MSVTVFIASDLDTARFKRVAIITTTPVLPRVTAKKSYGLEPNCQINQISSIIFQTNKFYQKWILNKLETALEEPASVFFICQSFAENVIRILLLVSGPDFSRNRINRHSCEILKYFGRPTVDALLSKKLRL